MKDIAKAWCKEHSDLINSLPQYVYFILSIYSSTVVQSVGMTAARSSTLSLVMSTLSYLLQLLFQRFLLRLSRKQKALSSTSRLLSPLNSLLNPLFCSFFLKLLLKWSVLIGSHFSPLFRNCILLEFLSSLFTLNCSLKSSLA